MKNHITRLHSMIERSLFYVDPPLGYRRILRALRTLAAVIHENSDSDESLWSIGECGACDLASLIVGAYWFCAENHSGQGSDEYLTKCFLGLVFSPGMTDGPEPDSTELDVYQSLMHLASQE